MTSLDEELSPRGWERYREVMAAPTSRPLPSFVPLRPMLTSEAIRAGIEFGICRQLAAFGGYPDIFVTVRILAEKKIVLLPVEQGGAGVKDRE